MFKVDSNIPKDKTAKNFSGIRGVTTGLLLHLTNIIFHMTKFVILDSGVCVLRGIIEIQKRRLFYNTLIKRLQYWTKYVDDDAINNHFEGKIFVTVGVLSGTLENTPFHIFLIEETYYTMNLISTYGKMKLEESSKTITFITKKCVLKLCQIIFVTTTLCMATTDVSMH